MATYLGFDVLDQVGHNMREAIAEAFGRHGQLYQNPTGKNFFDDQAGESIPSRSFSWFAHDRAAIGALRSFLSARKGRLVPFWVPTFGSEFVMSQNALAAQSSVRVFRWGYADQLFPNPARKHLALVKPTGAFLMRKVTLVTDNGDGTEDLSLSAGLGEDLAAARTQVCFLVLCRLEADAPPIDWASTHHAEASLSFLELPHEVPV